MRCLLSAFDGSKGSMFVHKAIALHKKVAGIPTEERDLLMKVAEAARECAQSLTAIKKSVR